MRRLSKRKALSLVKELDAFPKVPQSYVETSASGGTGAWWLYTSDSQLVGRGPLPGQKKNVKNK